MADAFSEQTSRRRWPPAMPRVAIEGVAAHEDFGELPLG